MITFNLAKLKENNKVSVKNTDEAFDNSPLANQEFEVVVSKLTRSQKIDIATEAMDGEKISNGKYSKAMFIKSIREIEGMEVEGEADIREVIWEYGDDVLVDAIKQAIDSFTKADEEKKSDFDPLAIG